MVAAVHLVTIQALAQVNRMDGIEKNDKKDSCQRNDKSQVSEVLAVQPSAPAMNNEFLADDVSSFIWIARKEAVLDEIVEIVQDLTSLHFETHYQQCKCPRTPATE